LSNFVALTDNNGRKVLIARVTLTEAGYYRARI